MTDNKTSLTASNGVKEIRSPYSFADTVQHLHAAFSDKGLKIFATIDQQAEALGVDLKMPPTTLIIFGNPKAGTPLMVASPLIGIDLPLKVLISEASPGEVTVYFNTTEYLIARHSLPDDFSNMLQPAEQLIMTVLAG
jgi:uncharacterized protein (DUF302 family)